MRLKAAARPETKATLFTANVTGKKNGCGIEKEKAAVNGRKGKRVGRQRESDAPIVSAHTRRISDVHG